MMEATEARLNEKKHLEELSLRWCRSRSSRHDRVDDEEEVLEGMEPHSNLKKLEIREYPGAKTPSWMQHMRSLRLNDCPNLTGVPRLPFNRLEVINCPSLTGVARLPDSLKRLEVIHCPELKQLSPFPRSLEYLEIENSAGFEDLFSIFISFNEEEEENSGLLQPFALDYLKIEDCSVLSGETFNLSLRKFDLLSTLELGGLPKLTSLLLGPNLKYLFCIVIVDCENLQSLEGMGALPHLEHLEIGDLPELIEMENLQALKTLEISKCPKLTTGVRAGREGAIVDRLPSLTSEVEIDEPMLLAVLLEKQVLNSIERLRIQDCSHGRPFSTEEEGLFLQLTSIKNLSFYYCEKLPSLPANLEKLSSLASLGIFNCPEMESLPNLPTSLAHLSIDECPKMESLPSLPTSLNKLQIFRCPKLKDKYGEGGPLHHEITHIPHIVFW